MSKKSRSFMKTEIAPESEPVIVAIVTTIPAAKERMMLHSAHPDAETPPYFQHHVAGVHDHDTVRALTTALTDWLFNEAMTRGPLNGLQLLNEFSAACEAAIEEAHSLIGVSFKHWGRPIVAMPDDVPKQRLSQASFNHQTYSADREDYITQLPGRMPTKEEAQNIVSCMTRGDETQH
jgi:hypothetical protein